MADQSHFRKQTTPIATGLTIAAGLLFWATASHDYGYYTFLRWFVTGVAVYTTAVIHDSYISKVWVTLIVITAIIFNPIIPIHMDKETWSGIDIACGTIFAATALRLIIAARRIETRTEGKDDA